MTLTPDEIRLIRSHSLSRRDEFMAMAREVCELMDVSWAKICAPTRGKNSTCAARNLICRIAHDRGFSFPEIGRYINREFTSVKHAVRMTYRDRPKDSGK
jgi:hypothetical protein